MKVKFIRKNPSLLPSLELLKQLSHDGCKNLVVQGGIRRKKFHSSDVGLSGTGLACWWIAKDGFQLDLVLLVFCGPTGSPVGHSGSLPEFGEWWLKSCWPLSELHQQKWAASRVQSPKDFKWEAEWEWAQKERKLQAWNGEVAEGLLWTHYFNVGSELVLISSRGVCAGSQQLYAGKDQSQKNICRYLVLVQWLVETYLLGPSQEACSQSSHGHSAC